MTGTVSVCSVEYGCEYIVDHKILTESEWIFITCFPLFYTLASHA